MTRGTDDTMWMTINNADATEAERREECDDDNDNTTSEERRQQRRQGRHTRGECDAMMTHTR